EYPRTPQPEAHDLKPAPKLSRETTEINWNQPAITVRNFVRGLSPYPTAWTKINGKVFKIYAVSLANESPFAAEPAEAYSDNKKLILVRAADGWLQIDALQAEGKRRMTAEEFLRGNRLN